MSDGALRIPITGDASQFKATLSEVESSLKYFKEKLKSAKGDQIGKINFTISGLEETKNALTTFGKFAEGTLGQLYQKLEQLKTLRLTIQADATALTPVNNAIDETTKKIKDLLNAGLQKPIVEAAQVSANSIQGLKNRIDELNQKKLNLDAKDDYLQIVKLNQEIDKLKTQINNLNKLGLKVDQTIDPAVNSFKNLTNTSNKSRQALTSLSLVAQDLPFGFIAIQNNLPAVISSFGALNASSNGIKGTLAALGAGLVGPAGLFLAFSVVTGAVTYAIQKYGSLGAAVKEFLGTTTKLDIVLKKSTESLDKYNKELETTEEITGRGRASASGEIIRIQTLASAVRDVTLSEKQRANALKELQKLDPETLKNIDLQRDGYGYLDKFVKQYTDSLIANAVAQEYLSKVVATTTQINQQSLALQEIAKGYADIAQRRRQAEAQPQFDPATGADLTTTILGGLEVAQKNLNKRFFDQTIIVSNLYQELNTYKSSLEAATIQSLDFFKGLKKGASSADEATTKIKGLKEELQGVIPLFDLLLPSKEQFNFDFLKEFFGPNFIKQLKEAQKKINDAQKGIDKFKNGDPFGFLPDQAPTIIPSYESEKENLRLKELAKEFEDARVVLEEVFFAPLSDLFANFFDTGKFAFEEFGKAILNTIKSIVSKIIATGIINLLANMLNPLGGIASAAFGGAATGAGGGIIGALKAAFNSVLGIGKIANPNFGGVQGGGMQLAGEVVFRQRGSDLIGVINRTNGTINRVG